MVSIFVAHMTIEISQEFNSQSKSWEVLTAITSKSIKKFTTLSCILRLNDFIERGGVS